MTPAHHRWLHLSGGPFWTASGIAALVLVNIVFDLATGGSTFGPGGFLHTSWIGDGLSGALIDITNHASRIIILAIGMTLVIALRGIDLSVGSVMAISGAVAAMLTSRGYPPAAAIAAALAVSAACGLWNALLVAGMGLQPFVATLVLMVAGRGIAQMITDGQVTTFHSPTLEFLGNGRALFPVPFILAALLLVTVLIATRATALGLLLRAVGGNPVASELAGVRAKVLIAGTYIFSGLCAGLAGLIDAANIKAADPFHAGVNAELAAIFAVVVGGTALTGGRFSLIGAFLGGLLMQTLTATMYARDVSPEVAPLPQAIVILLVCLIASPAFRARLRARKAATA